MSAPPPVTAVNEAGPSPYLLLCEHASNHVPAAYAGLGLSPDELGRHIAYDLGAAPLARRLSTLLDAPLYLAGYSRLLIDCNRPPGTPTSIPTRSEATDIPGNTGLDAAERARRATAYFTPFHDRVGSALDARQSAGRRTIVVGVHSFTPVFLGVPRPWEVGILYGAATHLACALVAALGRPGDPPVGDNEPYKVEADYDYTVPVHGDARGLDAVLLEVRQDLLASAPGVEAWAGRLAAALSQVAEGH